MADYLESSVSIDFQSGDETEDLGPPALVLEQDTNKAPYGYAFARMYFVGPAPNVVSTSGNPVQTVNRNVTSDELEMVTFPGRDTASFSTPGVSNVSLQPLGRLIGLRGQTLSNVSLTVDTARGTIRASQPFYGTVQAQYNSSFHRLSCAFRAIQGAEDNPAYVSEFAPMVLVAQQGANEPESLTLTPPTKKEKPGETGGGYTVADNATGEIIVLEIDQEFPIALTHSTQEIPGLAAVARVLVYSSHSGVTFSVSKGFVQPDKYNLADSVPRTETVNFAGSQSASTKYPPANGVSVTQVGSVTSKATPGGIFHFATAPQDVATADWFSYGAYLITGVRRVQSNEIVATTSGVTVPVSGQVLASYNTVRTAVNVFWPREGTWFGSVVLTAKDPYGNTESIVISPPERRGR